MTPSLTCFSLKGTIIAVSQCLFAYPAVTQNGHASFLLCGPQQALTALVGSPSRAGADLLDWGAIRLAFPFISST